MEKKPEVKILRNCIACLKDENEVLLENYIDSKISEMYTILIQDEVCNHAFLRFMI